MAFSSVKVQFEIGHEASLRNKRTPEGFTHDWEVFVRGADNTEIQHFVEKVVFHLHETFPKPKRVVKEPPYSVKECGYAGFVLPIEVYLKNREEPKKIAFQHDLQLQTSGPPISKVNREPRIFQNPSEDFRRNLIRGGGVGVDGPSDEARSVAKKSTQSPKKLEDVKPTTTKKHKPDLSLNNSFAELFGTPIRRITPEPKKLVEIPKKDVDRKKTSKHLVTKEDKEYKDKIKDKEKQSKEKPKRPLSPPPPTKVKEDVKKEKSDEKERKRDESSKDKERKEKRREKDEKSHKKDKKPKEPDIPKKSLTEVVEKPPAVETPPPEVRKEKSEKEKHRHKHKKREKEKTREKEKHKHKEKDEKEVKEKEKLKKKADETNIRVEKDPLPPVIKDKPKAGPLTALFSELSSSASAISDDDDDDPLPPVRIVPDPPPRPVPEIKFTPAPIATSKSKDKDTYVDKKLKLQKSEESSSLKAKKERSPKKRSSKGDSEVKTKRNKVDRERSYSSEREREKEAREAEILLKQQEEQQRRDREKAEEERRLLELKEREEEAAKKEREAAEAAAQKSKSTKGRKRNREKGAEEISKPEEPPPRVELTKEYLAQLRDLQNRIMTIEDNAELQKVVKVIAESGQYEVTKKTFDFDLCALDQATVRRLQQFFESPT